VKEEKAHKASYTNGFKELADAKSKNVYPLFLQKTGPRDAMPEALRERDSFQMRTVAISGS
jgi:beta-xylosidase